MEKLSDADITARCKPGAQPRMLKWIVSTQPVFLRRAEFRRSVLYTTLSSCSMCSGAVVFFKIPKVVIAENTTLKGAEDYLKAMGVEVEVLDDPSCIKMLSDFEQQFPGRWRKGG